MKLIETRGFGPHSSMCYFITVAVPEAQIGLLQQAVPRKLQLSSNNNPSVLKWVASDVQTFLVTTDGCSCDLYRAAGVREDAAVEADLRRKYVRKGWSEAKIQRALVQARTARARRPAFTGLRPDLLALLCRVATEVEGLSLLVHWYDGDPETEKVAIRGRTVTSCTANMPPVEPDWLVKLEAQQPFWRVQAEAPARSRVEGRFVGTDDRRRSETGVTEPS